MLPSEVGTRNCQLNAASVRRNACVFAVCGIYYSCTLHLPELRSRRSTALHPRRESKIWNTLRSGQTAASRRRTTSLWVKIPRGAGCTGTCGSDLSNNDVIKENMVIYSCVSLLNNCNRAFVYYAEFIIHLKDSCFVAHLTSHTVNNLTRWDSSRH